MHLSTYSLASLLCASSNTIGLFLGARALQGLGIAFIAHILLSTFGFVGIATAPIAGYLTDFIGRKKMLLTGLTILLGAFLILMQVNSYTAFFIPLAIMGIGNITIFTTLNTMIVECVPESRGAAASIYNSCRFLGYGLAPVATLPVYLVYGLEGIVLLCVCFVVMNIVISTRVRG